MVYFCMRLLPTELALRGDIFFIFPNGDRLLYLPEFVRSDQLRRLKKSCFVGKVNEIRINEHAHSAIINIWPNELVVIVDGILVY